MTGHAQVSGGCMQYLVQALLHVGLVRLHDLQPAGMVRLQSERACMTRAPADMVRPLATILDTRPRALAGLLLLRMQAYGWLVLCLLEWEKMPFLVLLPVMR